METKIKFLMISRLLYDKGYSQFVDAAKEVKSKFPATTFQLLGDVDEDYPNHVTKAVLEKDISDGAIEYLGYHSDVKPFIQSADCIVLPSFYNEGLSRVLMEAMALKKPIITTNTPGCKEAVEEGVNGFLCEPKDTSSLISNILRFINLSDELKKQMGVAGRKRAEEIFNIKNVIDIYHSITDKYELNKSYL